MFYKNLFVLFTLTLSFSDAVAKDKVLVIYYSRSGSTALMAREIAKHYKADVVKVTAEKYPDTFFGNRAASSDAWDEKEKVKIKYSKFKIAKYDKVFIGSPIWWYRPAVPLWQLVHDTAFKKKKVILFNTFNSKFKKEHIQKFRKLLKSKNAAWAGHLYVRRGRITWQISEKELIEKNRALLKEKKY